MARWRLSDGCAESPEASALTNRLYSMYARNLSTQAHIDREIREAVARRLEAFRKAEPISKGEHVDVRA